MAWLSPPWPPYRTLTRTTAVSLRSNNVMMGLSSLGNSNPDYRNIEWAAHLTSTAAIFVWELGSVKGKVRFRGPGKFTALSYACCPPPCHMPAAPTPHHPGACHLLVSCPPLHRPFKCSLPRCLVSCPSPRCRFKCSLHQRHVSYLLPILFSTTYCCVAPTTTSSASLPSCCLPTSAGALVFASYSAAPSHLPVPGASRHCPAFVHPLREVACSGASGWL